MPRARDRAMSLRKRAWVPHGPEWPVPPAIASLVRYWSARFVSKAPYASRNRRATFSDAVAPGVGASVLAATTEPPDTAATTARAATAASIRRNIAVRVMPPTVRRPRRGGFAARSRVVRAAPDRRSPATDRDLVRG